MWGCGGETKIPLHMSGTKTSFNEKDNKESGQTNQMEEEVRTFYI